MVGGEVIPPFFVGVGGGAGVDIRWKLALEVGTSKLHSTSSFAIKKRFDFADELKVGDVRYKHLTQITIKVQLFWRLPYDM